MADAQSLEVDGDALLASSQPLAGVSQQLDDAAGKIVMACTANQPATVGEAVDGFNGSWGGLLQEISQGTDAFYNAVVQAVIVYAKADQALANAAQPGPGHR